METLGTKVILAIIASVYGLLLLRLIQMTIYARKIGSDVMHDVVFLKSAIGVSISVIALGGVVTWLIYSANAADLYLAVCIIDLLVTLVNSFLLSKSAFLKSQ